MKPLSGVVHLSVRAKLDRFRMDLSFLRPAAHRRRRDGRSNHVRRFESYTHTPEAVRRRYQRVVPKLLLDREHGHPDGLRIELGAPLPSFSRLVGAGLRTDSPGALLTAGT